MTNLKNISPNFAIESKYPGAITVGIDEAGRGPLAGPVVAGLALLPSDFENSEISKKINDSKKISAKKRQEIYLWLTKNIKYSVGSAKASEIDEINILNATKLAMKRAYQQFIEKYQISPEILLIDGNFTPFAKEGAIKEIKPIVKGDQKSLSIAAASIIAKQYRDEIMQNLHQKFPQYNWLKNAAYPTKEHLDAIKQHGICQHHRKTFKPIKNANY